MEEKNYFNTLNEINVSDKIEKKGGLSYLSWAWAWGELKKVYPNAEYIVYERENGINYFDDGRTAWVKTGVIVNDLEHIDYLPIMDFKNKSMPLETITSFDVNKTIQRSITKAIARHGLGLYIYAGEDLPEEDVKMCESKEEALKVKITFGKHSGKTLEDLEGDNYLNWIMDNTKDEYLKSAVKFLVKEVTEEDITLMGEFMDKLTRSESDLEEILKYFKVSKTNELTKEQIKACIEKFDKKLSK